MNTTADEKTSRGRSKAVAKWAKRALMSALAFGLIALIVIAALPKPVPVDLVEAKRGPFLVTIDEDGRTRVKDRYVIGSPVTGSVGRIELDPGDSVEEDALLARVLSLEPPLMDARSRAQANARVEQARAAVKQARATAERVEQAAAFAAREGQRQRQLARQGSVSETLAERAELEARTSQEELASARFAVRVADYELRVAEQTLARPASTKQEQVLVRAPVGGKVLKVIQQSEGVVQAGTPLLELGDPRALEIVVDVLTSDAVHVRPGAKVLIERWGGEHALSGRVRVVEPSAFTRLSALGVEEQRVNIVVDLEDAYERWSALGDGYRVEVRIVVWSGEDVLQVPSSAVFRHGEQWAVYKVTDGKATRVEVTTAHRNGLAVEITRGLEPGDALVLHPSDQVSDGVAVAAR